MSAVDVLAVLDGDIEGMRDVLPRARGQQRIDLMLAIDQMLEARDAVAELIEADKAFDNACAQADAWPDDADLQDSAGYAMRRRATALARAQGGAA